MESNGSGRLPKNLEDLMHTRIILENMMELLAMGGVSPATLRQVFGGLYDNRNRVTVDETNKQED